MAHRWKVEESALRFHIIPDRPLFPKEVKLVHVMRIPLRPVHLVLSRHLLLVHRGHLSIWNHSRVGFQLGDVWIAYLDKSRIVGLLSCKVDSWATSHVIGREVMWIVDRAELVDELATLSCVVVEFGHGWMQWQFFLHDEWAHLVST